MSLKHRQEIKRGSNSQGWGYVCQQLYQQELRDTGSADKWCLEELKAEEQKMTGSEASRESGTKNHGRESHKTQAPFPESILIKPGCSSYRSLRRQRRQKWLCKSCPLLPVTKQWLLLSPVGSASWTIDYAFQILWVEWDFCYKMEGSVHGRKISM